MHFEAEVMRSSQTTKAMTKGKESMPGVEELHLA